jgi:hypothetical protein
MNEEYSRDRYKKHYQKQQRQRDLGDLGIPAHALILPRIKKPATRGGIALVS